MKHLGLLTLILYSTISLGQDVHSKYPCDTALTYDILISGATFSGTRLDKQIELQDLIYALEDHKSITGKYFVKFVVNCDGTTKEIQNKLPGNTIYNQIIADFMTKFATENNWSPAIHREKRVPHRKIISVEVKKGKIKEFEI